MLDAIIWFFTHVLMGVVNIVRVVVTPSAWPNFGDNVWLAHLISYGASAELFFAIFDVAVILLLIGLWRRAFLWRVVRAIEGWHNLLGRVTAWAVFIMVVQQVVIVGLQRIFRVSQITVGPFGYTFTKDLSWFGEELKLYNAMIVCLCAAYTFVQAGHVRVDLFYAGLNYSRKRIVDMFGALFFMIPLTSVIWLFGWYFLWRSLITPKVAPTDTLEQLVRKANLMHWNVETIGFSPNGFNGYFLFKVLLVAFAGTMFVQGLAHFYRSLLEYLEGPESEALHHDPDSRLDRSAEAMETGNAPPAGAEPATEPS